MKSLIRIASTEAGLTDDELRAAVRESLADTKQKLHKVLLLPPDYTRFHSYAGRLTAMYYEELKDTCEIDILPALGTHVPVTKDEWVAMCGPDVPFERVIVHNWRTDVVKIGEVPGEYVASIS